jgi:hypothetical protein
MSKIKLFNRSTNKAESVDHDKVDELISTGSYEFVPGSRINVLSPDGQAGTIDATEAVDAIGSGFKFDTAKMQAERKLMEEYDDKNVQAGLAGIARGVTLGASDVALRGLGVSADHLRRLDEANPSLSLAGEVAGTIGGVLATGGGSAAASGAAAAGKTALGAAAKATTKAGMAAERAMAASLKHAGIDASKSLAQKIVANSAPTVARGAVEGSLIGAGDVISEHALGRADLNAENLMAAGGIGAVIGGSGNLLFKGLEVAVPKALKATKGAGEYVHKRYLAPERIATDILELTEAKVAKLGREGITPFEYTNLMERKLIPPKGKDFVTHFDDVLAADSDRLAQVYKQADDVVGNTVTADQLFDRKKYVDRIQKIIDDSSSLSESSAVRDIRRLKKDIEEGNFLPKRAEMRMDMDGIEKRVLVADESVGPFQSVKRVLDKLDDLSKHDKLAAPTKTQELAQSLRKDLRDDINNALDAIVKERGDLDPALKGVFDTIREQNRDMYVMLKLRPFVERKDAKEVTDKFFNFRTALNTFMGGAAFGVEGALGAIALKVANMDGVQLAKFRLLSKIEDKAVSVQTRMQNAVDRFTKAGRQIPKLDLAAKKAITDISYDPEPKKRESETKEQAFKRVSEELSRLESIEAKTELLSKRMETLNQVAPETAAELAAKVTNGIEFLREKLPVDPKEGLYYNPAFSKWKPSKLQLAKFERYASAVEDPMSVIESFGKGVVDREGIETLQVVYPELYSQLQTSVIDRITSMKEPLSYQKRLELKSVLGINLDPALQSDKINMLQNTFVAQEMAKQQQPQGQIAPNAPRGKLSVNNLATETEAHVTTSELA